jgi:hypothetical protein
MEDRGSIPGGGREIFPFATQPPIKWEPRALSPGVKRPGREADHSPASSIEFKNTWCYTTTTSRLHGVMLS